MRGIGLSPPDAANALLLLRKLAGSTGLEPAASAVTGQRSNQLNYDPLSLPTEARGASEGWWAVQVSNLRQPACKAGALPLS